MPRGDRTGPLGLGTMTGRALGYCAGYAVPGFANQIGHRLGCGMAWGRGGVGGLGLAWRRGRAGFFAPYTGFVPPTTPAHPSSAPEEETLLKSQLSLLEERVEAVKARLEEIEKSKTAD